MKQQHHLMMQQEEQKQLLVMDMFIIYSHLLVVGKLMQQEDQLNISLSAVAVAADGIEVVEAVLVHLCQQVYQHL